MIGASIQCPEEKTKATQACIDFSVCDSDSRGGFPTFDCQSFVIHMYSQELNLSLSTTSRRILNVLLEATESRAFPPKQQKHKSFKGRDKILALEKVCTLDWEGSSSNVKRRKLKEESNSFWTTSNAEREKKARSHMTEVENGLQLTDIDWSSGSTSICASYKINDHDNEKKQQYCQGALVVWDVLPAQITATESPSFVYEFDSPLTCVAGHPRLPNVFGSGSQSGEVLLVDFNQETPLVAISQINCYCHIESISDIKWYFNHERHEWLLCSISPDGKVLFWQNHNNFKYPVQGFRLELNGKLLGGSKLGISKRASSSSHTSSTTKNDTFVIGCDCGVVLYIQQNIGIISGISSTITEKLKCRWTYHAMQLISCLAGDMQTKIIHDAEARAHLQRQDIVDCSTIFEMNPLWDIIYPSISRHSSTTSSRCQTLTSHNGRVTSVHVNDNCGAVLSSGMDGIAYLYSMTDGEEGSLVEPLTIETRDMSPIADASFLSNVRASHSSFRDVYFIIKSRIQTLLGYLLTTVTLSLLLLKQNRNWIVLGDGGGGIFMYNALQSILQPEVLLHKRDDYGLSLLMGYGGLGNEEQAGDSHLRLSIKGHSSSSVLCAFGNRDGRLQVWHLTSLLDDEYE